MLITRTIRRSLLGCVLRKGPTQSVHGGEQRGRRSDERRHDCRELLNALLRRGQRGARLQGRLHHEQHGFGLNGVIVGLG